MKKQLFFLILLLNNIILFTGCNKDDNHSIFYNLQGRWDLVNEIDRHYENEIAIENHSYSYNIGEDYVIFKGDNITRYVDNEKFSATFKISGNQITVTANDRITTSTIKWNNENQIAIIYRSQNDMGVNSYVEIESVYNRNK